MTRTEIYKHSLTTYGWLALLYLLKENQEKENYSECAIILSVVKELSEKHDLDLPTEYGEEAIIQAKIFMMVDFGFAGDGIEKRIPKYAQSIRENLKLAQ